MGKETKITIKASSEAHYITKAPISLVGSYAEPGVVLPLTAPIEATVGVPITLPVEFAVVRGTNLNRLLRWSGKVRIENEGCNKTKNLEVEALFQTKGPCGSENECNECSGNWKDFQTIQLELDEELCPNESIVLPFSYDFPINDDCIIDGARVIFKVSIDNFEAKKCEKGPKEIVVLDIDCLCEVVEQCFIFRVVECGETFVQLDNNRFLVTITRTYTTPGLVFETVTGELVLPNGEFVRQSVTLPILVASA